MPAMMRDPALRMILILAALSGGAFGLTIPFLTLVARERGVYVIGFSFPVVPKGQARIRTQMSAAHTDTDIDTAVAAFVKVGTEMGVIA